MSDCPRCTRLAGLVPGIRQRADALGDGIAARELHHLTTLLDGILAGTAGPYLEPIIDRSGETA